MINDNIIIKPHAYHLLKHKCTSYNEFECCLGLQILHIMQSGMDLHFVHQHLSALVCCKPFHPKRVAYKNSPASYLRQSLTFIIIDNFVSHHVHSLRRFWLRMQIAGAHFAYRPGRQVPIFSSRSQISDSYEMGTKMVTLCSVSVQHFRLLLWYAIQSMENSLSLDTLFLATLA